MNVVKSERHGLGEIRISLFGDGVFTANYHIKDGGDVSLGGLEYCVERASLYAAAVRLLEQAEAERKPVVVHGVMIERFDSDRVSVRDESCQIAQWKLALNDIKGFRFQARNALAVLGEKHRFQLLRTVDACLNHSQWSDVFDAAEKMLKWSSE